MLLDLWPLQQQPPQAPSGGPPKGRAEWRQPAVIRDSGVLRIPVEITGTVHATSNGSLVLAVDHHGQGHTTASGASHHGLVLTAAGALTLGRTHRLTVRPEGRGLSSQPPLTPAALELLTEEP